MLDPVDHSTVKLTLWQARPAAVTVLIFWLVYPIVKTVLRYARLAAITVLVFHWFAYLIVMSVLR